MLNVVRRPESFCGRIVTLVEECVERFQEEISEARHSARKVRLAQAFANHAFELWKRRRSRCPFRECNHVRMAYCGFNRGQYLVEWPGRDQTESLDLNCGYHPDHLSCHSRQAWRVPLASLSRSRRRVAVRVPARFLYGSELRATRVLFQTK